MKICICGGGNLGHVVAGFVAAQGKHEVCLLTRQPERWSKELTIEAPDTTYKGVLNGIYSDAKEAVSNADIVLLCLPGYGIRQTLLQVKDYLRSDAAVGTVVSSTGFFFQAMEILPASQTLFGFQRVPFISRIIEYGHRARLMGYKESLELAIEHCAHPELLRDTLSDMLHTPIHLLGSHYEVSLSNSNPLLHPSRLYSLWKDWHPGIVYDRIPLFYEEWTEEAAELYINMDRELQALLEQLPVRKGSIATVLDYYESTDAPSLARKLRSIEAFKGIASPMKPVDGGFVPDFHSRYFTEDFPYGLAFVHRLAHEKGVPSPTIDKIYEWGISIASPSTYIFDLDGTLLDTLRDLAASVNYAMRQYGMPEHSIDDIRRFVGNGVRLLMERATPQGADNPQFDEVFAAFRQHYMHHSLDTTQPYDGIPEMIHQLKQRGCKLAVVSNKMMAATQELVAHFFPEIEVAIGENEAGGIRKKPAPDTVEEALRRLGVDKSSAVYVGDSEVDIQTAHNSGIPCISVLWGFRSKSFLQSHGATTFIEHPLDLTFLK